MARIPLESLRSLLQEKGQLTPLQDFGRLTSGFPELDRALGGGYLRGGISELVGGPGAGTASLALQAMAHLTREGGLVAHLDPGGTLDPGSLRLAGADPERILWVRPPDLASTLRAADWIAESGNFPLMVLDLLLPGPGLRSPPGVWVRLSNRLRQEPVALLVLTPTPRVGPLAKTTLVLSPGPVDLLPGSGLLRGRELRVEVRRNRVGPVGEELRLWTAPESC